MRSRFGGEPLCRQQMAEAEGSGNHSDAGTQRGTGSALGAMPSPRARWQQEELASVWPRSHPRLVQMSGAEALTPAPERRQLHAVELVSDARRLVRNWVRSAAGACVALGLFLPPTAVLAQDAMSSAPAADVVVLDEALEPWVTSAHRAAALCYETIGQLINEHAVLTDPKRLANAQKLRDALGALLDANRTELFAKGLAFEQSQAIDSYFYRFTQPRTASYAATKQPGELAIDLRTCPSAAQGLELQLKQVSQ